jgi:lipopolysaccharide transport protein LptA
MKIPSLPVLFLLGAICCVRAQTAPATDAGTDSLPVPAVDAGTDASGDVQKPGTTQILSDELHMDDVTHIAVYTGNVLVTGTNFSMKCEEMTVNFTKGGQVDTITAKGSVVIVQPGRITHCGQAVYFHDEDKFILTDQPIINDNGRTEAAPKITIYRARQEIITEGKSKMMIPEGSALTNPSTANPK